VDPRLDGSGGCGETCPHRAAGLRGRGEHADRGAVVDATVTTVPAWRERYQSKGMPDWRMLRARVGSGPWITGRSRPRRFKPPPKKLDVTHWSSRLLADRLGISDSSVARAWRA
jgi:hypothetical protein